MKNRPNFFIVGAPKSGTTALASWLSEHPNIFMSEPKEPQYYSTDLSRKEIQYQNINQYLQLFASANENHKVLGEATPRYLYSDIAIGRIIQENPNAKMLVSLRNPIDMAPSLHGERLLEGDEDIEEFEEAWRAQGLRAQGKNLPALCTEPRLLLYGQACSLGSQLERLLSLVPDNQILIVFLEDIQKDPKKVYRDILRFLEVEDDERVDFPVVNAAARRRWPALQYAIRRIHYLRSKLGVPPLQTGLLSALKKMNRVAVRRKPLSIHLKKELLTYFKIEIEKVEFITGRNLEHWKH